MNQSHIIKSLNLTEGDSLTLEKAKDRMEFEALPLLTRADCGCHGTGNSYTNCGCNNGNDTCSCNTKVIENCPSKGLA